MDFSDETIDILMTLDENESTEEGNNLQTSSENPKESSLLTERMKLLKKKRVEQARLVASTPILNNPKKGKIAQPAMAEESDSMGYSSEDDEDGGPKEQVDMSVFSEVLKDSMAANKTKESFGNSGRTIPQTTTQTQNEKIDEFSGLNIKDRTLPAAVVQERLRDFNLVKLQASGTMCDMTGAWVTAGVLTGKAKSKNKSGSSYTLWTISNLNYDEIKILLVSKAFDEHWRETEGTIFAIVNAEAQSSTMGNGNTILKVKKPEQLLKLGKSEDFGICKGETKAGNACNNGVNRRKGNFCQYHYKDEARGLRSARMELDGGNLGNSVLYSGKRQLVRNSVGMEGEKEEKKQVASKAVSKEAMQNLLKAPEQVTSRAFSQGLRFLMLATGKTPPDSTVILNDKYSQPLKRPPPGAPGEANPSKVQKSSNFQRSHSQDTHKKETEVKCGERGGGVGGEGEATNLKKSRDLRRNPEVKNQKKAETPNVKRPSARPEMEGSAKRIVQINKTTPSPNTYNRNKVESEKPLGKNGAQTVPPPIGNNALARAVAKMKAGAVAGNGNTSSRQNLPV